MVFRAPTTHRRSVRCGAMIAGDNRLSLVRCGKEERPPESASVFARKRQAKKASRDDAARPFEFLKLFLSAKEYRNINSIIFANLAEEVTRRSRSERLLRLRLRSLIKLLRSGICACRSSINTTHSA